MNSGLNQSSKNTNFSIRSIIKSPTTQKNFSSRANTQEIPRHNNSKNKSSSCRPNKNKISNNSLFNSKNSKEEFPKKFIGLTNVNITTKNNIETTSNLNTNTNIKNNNNIGIYKFKEILNQKDKKIAELETQIKVYKEKLKNQIRIFNINSSTNSFNLSKTRSSTNVNERNICQIRSLSNSHVKIKNPYPIMTRNTPKENIGSNFSKSKTRSKNKKSSNINNYNYSSKHNLKKPIINTQFFWSKNNENNIKTTGHVNNFKRNNFSSQKYKNKKDNNNINLKNKRAKSSNVEKNKRTNNMEKINVNNNLYNNSKDLNNSSVELMTLEETQQLCDKMLDKIKNVLELVKKATTNEYN